MWILKHVQMLPHAKFDPPFREIVTLTDALVSLKGIASYEMALSNIFANNENDSNFTNRFNSTPSRSIYAIGFDESVIFINSVPVGLTSASN